MAKEEISPRMRKLLEKGRAQAHARVIERGIVQFRADPIMMERLLSLSETRRIPLGTMIRNWISERLDSEDGLVFQAGSDVDALAEKIGAAVVDYLKQAKAEGTLPVESSSQTSSGQYYKQSNLRPSRVKESRDRKRGANY